MTNNTISQQIYIYFSKAFEMNEVIDCLIHGISPGQKYPPHVRAFCISLHGISARAYDFVREKFGKNMPHPETIREWFRQSNLDASSGISSTSMDALENMAKKCKEKGHQLIVSLIMDEMSIQRNMTWCKSTNRFIGLVDCGTVDSEEDFTLATNALVLLSLFCYSGHSIPRECSNLYSMPKRIYFQFCVL